MLNYEAVEKYAGPGLKAFIDRLYEANKHKLPDKLPLAFHMGSCVDNSRPANMWMMMAEEWAWTCRRCRLSPVLLKP